MLLVHAFRCQFFWLVGFLIVCYCGPVRFAIADEPGALFVEKLRERKFYDLAIAYLDQMESSPLASQAFKATIPLERAETLIQSTAQSRDLKFWEDRLATAEKLLSDYAAAATSQEHALKASESLANLRYRQARVYIMRSESDRLTKDEKQQALERARALLQDCLKSFDGVREQLKVELERVTALADQNDRDARERIEPLRNSFTQIRLRTPLARELLADTYAKDDPQRKALLTQAATEFQDIWDKYARYAAGVDACLSAARCQEKLGQPKEALLLLQEIFSQNDTAAFRQIKRAAALVAIDCWNAMEPYPFNQVIDRLEPMISSLTRDEQRQSEWLSLQFELARAYHAQATDLQKNQMGSPGDIGRINRTAAALLRIVSRNQSPSREAARKLMDDLKLDLPDEQPTESISVTTFAEAKQKAIDLAGELENQYSAIVESENQSATATNTQPKAVDVTREEMIAQLQQTAKESLAVLRQALTLADAETPKEDLNHIRYLQAFSNFVIERYHDVGLIGEFLLDKYPNLEWSRQTSGLAVNAYAKLVNQATPGGEQVFSQNRLESLCQRILSRWPGSAEANSAANVMTRLALSKGDFAAASQYFDAIPEDSPYKASLSQVLGQRRWFEYKNLKASLKPDEIAARQQELSDLLATARDSLRTAVAVGNDDEITFDTAFASLLLVNAYLESDNLSEAVEQLENAAVAPLDLIKQKHPAVFQSPKSPLFVSETYRTAINVYLGALRSAEDPAVWISKAQNILSALQQNLESRGDVNASEEMVSIYGLIATELRSQFQAINDSNQRRNLAKNLVTFLGPLEKNTGDAKVLLWVASTLVDTATALAISDADPESRLLAKELSANAIACLDRAEKTGFGNDAKSAARLLESQRLRARALKESGKYEESVKQYADVLAQKPAVLPIQIDAATTLQQWAAQTNSPRVYAMAIMGAEQQRDPQTKRTQNTIWGWRQLVLATRGQEQFVDEFYLCLYHLLECRIEHGKLEKSKAAFEAALKEIENARARDPELGGPKWKPRFEELERQLKLQVEQS